VAPAPARSPFFITDDVATESALEGRFRYEWFAVAMTIVSMEDTRSGFKQFVGWKIGDLRRPGKEFWPLISSPL